MRNFLSPKGFYSRMFLINVLILSSFSLFSAMVAGNIAKRYEQSQYFRNYDYALSSLQDKFQGKLSGFASRVAIYVTGGSGRCDARLCTLLETRDYESLSASDRSGVITLLHEMCLNDPYLTGFLLCSSETGNLYYYNRASSLMVLSSVPDSLSDIRPFSQNIVSDKVLDQIFESNHQPKPVSRMYGITGTLFQSAKEPLGSLIALYSSAELTNTLTQYPLDEDSTFVITGTDEKLFFHSGSEDFPVSLSATHTGGLHESIDIYSPAAPAVVTTNAMKYYISYIHNKKYGFNAGYCIPHGSLPVNYTASLIFGLSVGLFLVSLATYVATGFIGDKKVNSIRTGMTHIGATNLSYRIPASKGQDEFSQIISGFNRMCDELQENVEKSYIYELQQKKSELYALQTSINPHFLYNTLEIIRVRLTQGQNADASQMILLLSKIYRSQTNRSMYVSIGEELSACENFMVLYQFRFQNFEYEFDVPTGITPFGIPKNTIQPLIENYFVHGIDPASEDNFFTIMGSSYRENGIEYIRLEVSDNGLLISGEALEDLKRKLSSGTYSGKKDGGFALTNINNRLHIVFGNDCSMTPSIPEDGSGFSISLRFPARLPQQLEDAMN